MRMKGIFVPNASAQRSHMAESKPRPRPNSSQPSPPLLPQFRAAKSLRWTWIRINLTRSIVCEQFPPKRLILNDRENRKILQTSKLPSTNATIGDICSACPFAKKQRQYSGHQHRYSAHRQASID